MSKFLEILEQHDPANEDTIDAALKAKIFLHEKKIPFTSNGKTITIHTNDGDVVLEAKGIKKKKAEDADAEEDAESINASTGNYEVDQEVEKLGNKAASGMKGLVARGFRSKAQRAKSAMKERENVAGQAVDAYKKGTDRIKKGLQAVKQTRITPTY